LKGDGVLLVAFGGPGCKAEVEPFLQEILGPRLTPEILADMSRRYASIGGASPLVAITRRQANLLQEEIGSKYAVEPGMLHGKPSIGESLHKLRQRGCRRIFVLPSNPYPLIFGTGSSREAIEKLTAVDWAEIRMIGSWSHRPEYREAIFSCISQSKNGLAPDAWLLFTAHSLPLNLPRLSEYTSAIEETAAYVAQKSGGRFWRLAWQSRGKTPE